MLKAVFEQVTEFVSRVVRCFKCLSYSMESAVTRLLRSMGYSVALHRVIDGLEVDIYGVKVRGWRVRGVIVELKTLYRDSLRVQVERRRHLAHRIYVALPDWCVADALARLPQWVGVITYNPSTDEAEVLRKALPQGGLLANLIAYAIAEELGLLPYSLGG